MKSQKSQKDNTTSEPTEFVKCLLSACDDLGMPKEDTINLADKAIKLNL